MAATLPAGSVVAAITDQAAVAKNGPYTTLVIGTNQIAFGAALPTAGTWNVGDVCFSTVAAASGSPGWVYTTTGWKTMGNVGS